MVFLCGTIACTHSSPPLDTRSDSESDTERVNTDSSKALAYAELVDMLGAFEAFAAEADSLLPDGMVLWYDWEHLDSSLSARRDSLMESHSRRLSAIVAEHGLPPKENLSAPVEAAILKAARRHPIVPNAVFIAYSAAYILWRHSVDAPTQQRLLPAILERQMADAEGEFKQITEMSLTDRVRLRTDSVQVYGTQFCQVDGEIQAFPIEDRAFSEAYRKKHGLRSLGEHLSAVNQSCPCPDSRPCPDWARSHRH